MSIDLAVVSDAPRSINLIVACGREAMEAAAAMLDAGGVPYVAFRNGRPFAVVVLEAGQAETAQADKVLRMI